MVRWPVLPSDGGEWNPMAPWQSKGGVHPLKGDQPGSRLLPPRLRLLSFNIQAGLAMTQAGHYLTRSWRHVLPPIRDRHHQLAQIAHVIAGYDVVALQEVDGGSLRSAFVNQLDHLAQVAGFSYRYQQLNRDLGRFGQFSNGLLSRIVPYAVEEHRLPGLKGRGLILGRYGDPAQPLLVFNLHLALSVRARAAQFRYVHDLIGGARHVVVMGDLNCTHDELQRSALGDRAWQWPEERLRTYPSWQPDRHLDHILVSPSLTVNQLEVVPARLSDHLPVAMDLSLPAELVRVQASA